MEENYQINTEQTDNIYDKQKIKFVKIYQKENEEENKLMKKNKQIKRKNKTYLDKYKTEKNFSAKNFWKISGNNNTQNSQYNTISNAKPNSKRKKRNIKRENENNEFMDFYFSKTFSSLSKKKMKIKENKNQKKNLEKNPEKNYGRKELAYDYNINNKWNFNKEFSVNF